MEEAGVEEEAVEEVEAAEEVEVEDVEEVEVGTRAITISSKGGTKTREPSLLLLLLLLGVKTNLRVPYLPKSIK